MVHRWGRLVVLMTVTLASASATPARFHDRILDYQPQRVQRVSDERGSRQSASILKVVDRSADSSLTTEIDVTDAFGESGKPLALQIELQPPTLSDQLFVAITGIPSQFAVSPGIRWGTGWLLMAKELKSLIITAPDSFRWALPDQRSTSRQRPQGCRNRNGVNIDPKRQGRENRGNGAGVRAISIAAGSGRSGGAGVFGARG